MKKKIISFNDGDLKELQEKAANSNRLRAMHFFEVNQKSLHGPKSSLQMFVNAINQDSYVAPHKHEDYKLENFINPTDREKDLETLLTLISKSKLPEGALQKKFERWELFALLKGELKVVIFGDDGTVEDVVKMAKGPNCTPLVIIPPNTFHSVVALQQNTVVFELKNGWYDEQKDKQTAAWAPEENQTGSQAFMKWLKLAKKGQTAGRYKDYGSMNI